MIGDVEQKYTKQMQVVKVSEPQMLLDHLENEEGADYLET